MGAAVTVAACSPQDGAPPEEPSPDTVPPSADPGPQWPDPGEVDSAAIAGLSTYTVSDNDHQFHAVVPQLARHDAVNLALRRIADDQAEDYLKNMATDPDADAVASPWMSLTWTATAASAEILGVMVECSFNPGASTGTWRQSLWYDLEARRILQTDDLFTSGAVAEIVEAAGTALRDAGIDPDAEAVDSIITEGDAFVAFTSRGELLLGFDSHTVAEGAVGAPAVALADPLAQGWLSDRGEAALTASLEPAPETVPDASTVPEPEGGCTEGRCVALTFDDGPSPETTPRLLDILAEHQVRATFFVLGSQAQAFPEIIARQIEEGHEVANHSWSHPDLTSLSEEALREEVVRTNEAIEKVTGSAPTLLRPPYGATGPTVKRVAADLEMVQVMWDVDTRDWEHHDPARTLAAVGDASAGSIILMHDIHATTVDAVEDVITALSGEGFGFATVSSLLTDVTVGEVYRAAT